MKWEKSTQSLHSSSSAFILREHPPNSTITPVLSKHQRPVFRHQFSSVYNARGRLNTLREAITLLTEQARGAEVANKVDDV
jgi:hypothetical protein